jgi:hypothetical protein
LAELSGKQHEEFSEKCIFYHRTMIHREPLVLCPYDTTKSITENVTEAKTQLDGLLEDIKNVLVANQAKPL